MGPVAQNDSMSGDWWTKTALEAASKADVILYFGGTDLGIESEDKDRYSIAWPEAQLTLVQKIAALGKPTVVVELGDLVDDTPLLSNKNISAIIWAGFSWPGRWDGCARYHHRRVGAGWKAPRHAVPGQLHQPGTPNGYEPAADRDKPGEDLSLVATTRSCRSDMVFTTPRLS